MFRKDNNLPQVPERILKTVLFLAFRERESGGPRLAGTAFLVSCCDRSFDPDTEVPHTLPPDADAPDRVTWLVTASHVLDAIRREAKDDKVLLWVNTGTGRADPPPEIPVGDWKQIPADDRGYTVDIAFTEWKPESEHDIQSFPAEGFATSARIRDASIGLGYDVVTPGLFYDHTGEHRNVPVLRVGSLSAWADPDEPVIAGTDQMYAHIIETRSTRGLSGSPVYVGLPSVTWRDGEEDGKRFTSMNFKVPQFYFLGVLLGHFATRRPEVQDESSDKEEWVNAGLAYVVHHSYLLSELLEATKRHRAFR
jgi:hypothetical protein